MATKLRPRLMLLPQSVSAKAFRAADARRPRLQRLVGRRSGSGTPQDSRSPPGNESAVLLVADPEAPLYGPDTRHRSRKQNAPVTTDRGVSGIWRAQQNSNLRPSGPQRGQRKSKS